MPVPSRNLIYQQVLRIDLHKGIPEKSHQVTHLHFSHFSSELGANYELSGQVQRITDIVVIAVYSSLKTFKETYSWFL